MELHIKPQNTIVHSVQNFFKPFLQIQSLDNRSFIMPLAQVERALHNHYVTMQPLQLTFEYYDHQHDIRMETLTVTVESTIQTNRRIIVKDITNNHLFSISIEQILTVSANTA